MNKILLASAVTLLLAAGCNQSVAPQATSRQGQPTEQTQTEPTNPPMAQNQNLSNIPANINPSNNDAAAGKYVNNMYHFQMDLDSSWKGYKVVTSTNNVGVATVEFKMPYKDAHYGNGSGLVTALYIMVYPQREWTYELSQDVPHPQILKDTGTTVYAYSTWQAGPNDLLSLNIQGAIKSFEVIK
ncbi:MAG: hypothetical protein KGJ93_00160 [Patescibacteria group bacterium]|nr:hypothetical protein [Patescibacteria group bacterium]